MDNLFGSIIILIILLLFYIPTAWGLFTINKKLNEKHPWLAYIPVLQIYSTIKASGKSVWWILWMILIGLATYIVILILIGLISYLIFSGAINAESIIILLASNIILSVGLILFLYLIAYTLMSIGFIIVLHGISKRTNRGLWTTVGLFYIPYIMFPIVAYKLKTDTESINKSESILQDDKIEDKIEL